MFGIEIKIQTSIYLYECLEGKKKSDLSQKLVYARLNKVK